MENTLWADLDDILEHTEDFWRGVDGERFFITGGTGFFGCWLLESFLWARDRLNLRVEAVVLTRSAESFERKVPHLAQHSGITLHEGDVRTFTPPAGTFSHIVHAATEASVALNLEQPTLMLDTIVEGTRRVLNFASQCGARRLLHTSSGAAYGRQPHDLTHISEDYPGAPDTSSPAAAYGEGKRVAELLCTLYSRAQGFDTISARCYAFVGPYLPISGAFAIGNFIRDGLAGQPIVIGGDGTPYRSYLYASDLTIWLWTLLYRGQSCRLYNVGSDNDLQIKDVARAVQQVFEKPLPIQIKKEPVAGQPAERYVPSINRARSELGLTVRIELDEAIRRTITWHRQSVGDLPSV